MKKGIDVSQFQGTVDYNKVKASGIDFVIIRAGYGKYVKQKDPCFDMNYNNAKKAGLNVGVYWYSYADTEADARLEAKACLEVIKGKTFEYPIFFDLEEAKQFAKGSAFCNSLVKAFCSELEKAGYFAGLYISRSPLQQYIIKDIADKYALWIAEYSSCCNYYGTYGMWQYSSSGRVPGINGNVDMDYSYVDYPEKIRSKGLNGFPKPTVKSKPTLDSSGFKYGNKTLGVLALKQMLIKNGYRLDNNNSFGNGTEKAVNDLLKEWGYKQNGIAGTNFIRKLGEKL